MAIPNQAPQPERQAAQAGQPGEFDHLLGKGPEQHLTIEDAAVRAVEPAEVRLSKARAEVERNAKAGELNALYGPIEDQQPKG